MEQTAFHFQDQYETNFLICPTAGSFWIPFEI